MMDSGYFGANHAWLPFKKSEDESSAHLGYAIRDTDGSIRLCQIQARSRDLPTCEKSSWEFRDDDFVRLIAQPDCESSTDFESSDED